jgi:DNA-binding NarL/FixJ family response regulator
MAIEALGADPRSGPLRVLIVDDHALVPDGLRLPPQVVARLLDRAHSPAAFDSLTAREREVLAKIAQGSSNKEIAREMRISHHTVKTYVRRTLDKLGVESRTQAAVRALTEGPIRR